MSERKRQFIGRLNETGEAGVRESLALKRYGGDHIAWANLWLQEKDDSRAAEVRAGQDSLAQTHASAAQVAADAAHVQAEQAKASNKLAMEANEIARDANTKAQRANNLAIAAILVSSGCAVVTILIALVAAGRR